MDKTIGTFSKALFFAFMLIFVDILSANADVCFLPDGKCMSGIEMEDQPMPTSEPSCAGYGTKHNGSGWNCNDTCQANGHVYYRCVEKPCPEGFTSGINNCTQGYEYVTDNVYSGDLICGKCIENTCPDGTQLSSTCAQEGYIAQKTQYYAGDRPCYACINDNCSTGLKKKCTSVELALRTERTPFGSLCYKCCNNNCPAGSFLEKPTCPTGQSPKEFSRNACAKACYSCQDD
ncbi:MAG: hypothetical protein IJ738_03370 [Alphaproteobacteria bacterium]|nr:hypothetical protein [Alphaproteobacteria bacterium]